MPYNIINQDIIEYVESFEGKRFQAVLSDPPYALLSIAKRFGNPDAAPAKFGSDGRFQRASSGFMGQNWDSFDSLADYQDWVLRWAAPMIEKVLHPGALCMFFGGRRTWHHLALGLERAGFIIYDTIMWVYGQGFPKAHKIREGIYTPSALKPAWEPIILCMAPRGDFTFKKLMSEFGTGGINVEGGRVEAEKPYTVNTFDDGARPFGDAIGEKYTSRKETKGRWPADILGDPSFNEGWWQYFYCPKASKSEKGEYNNHPTVKPLDLCRYLATLLLPAHAADEPRRMLVPFAGTGSEMIGALMAGWEYIEGIELSEEYCELAERRFVKEGLDNSWF